MTRLIDFFRLFRIYRRTLSLKKAFRSAWIVSGLSMKTLRHYWWCYRMNRINNTFFGALRDTFRKPPF